MIGYAYLFYRAVIFVYPVCAAAYPDAAWSSITVACALFALHVVHLEAGDV